MKRILSACVEQTLVFETEADCQSCLRTYQRKRIHYKLLDKQTAPGGGVCIRIQREYNNYPIGDYFEPDR